MRPKLISLLAVSAFALIGCAAAEPAKSPDTATTAPVSESPAPDTKQAETATQKKTMNPNALVEQQFVDFADTRAGAHDATVNRTPKQIIKSLHAYCDEGKALKVSKSEDLNENMEYVADTAYCEMLK